VVAGPECHPALLTLAAPNVGVLEVKAKQLPELTLHRSSTLAIRTGSLSISTTPLCPELPTPPPYRLLQTKGLREPIQPGHLAPAQRVLGATGHHENTLPPARSLLN
jgi:hypothetical protein